MSDAIDCREARARLQDFLKEDLERCGHCFSEAKFEASFLLMLRSKTRHTCSPNALRARILDALRAEQERD